MMKPVAASTSKPIPQAMPVRSTTSRMTARLQLPCWLSYNGRCFTVIV
jgi:hypothetical protein